MNIKKEIELAIKRENPNWDGKSFDYGCSIYQNVLECYEAIQPLIEKAGHSGMSYSIFVDIFTRALNGKPLTPITEDDFKEEFSKESGLGDRTEEDGTIVRQCVRYSPLFRHLHKDGSVEYTDVERIVVIDQYGIGWSGGGVEKKCKGLIRPITLPYMPTNEPIKIYVWEFSYDPTIKPSIYKEKGTYNAIYIDRIVMPGGTIINVDRLYLDENKAEYENCKENAPKFYEELKAFIEQDIKYCKERTL